MSAPGMAGLKKFATVAALFLLVAALCVLVFNHLRWTGGERVRKEALEAAEVAARAEPAAAANLAVLVEQQTLASLRQERFQWLAGLTALVSGGVLVVLLQPPAEKKPALPETIRRHMPLPLADLASFPEINGKAPSESANSLTREEPKVDLALVARIVARIGRQQHHLIPVLHALQEEYNYLPRAALDELCRLTDVTPTQLAGVVSFYARFRTRPRGKHHVQVCRGTACHVAGADRVIDEFRRHLGIPAGEDTDAQLHATVESVGCLGYCTLAPVVKRGECLHERVRVEDLPELVATCRGVYSVSSGTYRPAKRGESTAGASSTNGHVSSDRLTHRLIRFFSRKADAEAISSIPAVALLNDRQDLTRRSPRVVTDQWYNGRIIRLSEYEQNGGFAALAKCLKKDPAAVIDEIERSGLRGRGGGGFLTARKWRLVAAAAGDKYIICNGDEGDPGAFMDRSIMESSPAAVLEGMLIAAYAVGAARGVVYVRNEYPLAVVRVRETIDQLRSKGLLGRNILGSGFTFDVEVVEGGGAFVCGEETALIESIMGQRGTPHCRPPYPAESGLWGRPTVVNNVETLACVPWILNHGAEQFAALGTATSKGTKLFSLAGKIRHGGLVEVPMGTTIRQLVDDFGGGVPEGRRFKAVQIGGPSGGCIPAELADTPIDYDALRELGAIMGSGGIVVLDDTDCMVDVARYFLEFTQQESCGHCTFCRVGTRKLLDILERICRGHGTRRELEEIETLSQSIHLGSLCGLGKTAPNPVLTTLRYFREEYEAHLLGHCPAGRCKTLIRYDVTTDCVGCTLCAQHCPVAAIKATPYRQHSIDSAICTRCDACRTTCPEQAIVVTSSTKSFRSRQHFQVA